MTVLQRIQREPAKLLAFVVALLAGAVALGWLTQAGSAIVLAIVAAAIGLLSYVVTPAREVVEQRLPTGEHITGRAGLVTDAGLLDVDDDEEAPKVCNVCGRVEEHSHENDRMGDP